MFVDITNQKSPLAVENLLTPYKKGRMLKGVRQPKEHLTPEICAEVLQSTNYARNIKDMLLCIAELPEDEQAQFKEILLATFEMREQPNDILALGKKLAHAAGFEAALNRVLKRKSEEKRTYLASAPERIWTLETTNSHLDVETSFEKYSRLLCLSDNTIRLGRTRYDQKILPPIIEAPNSLFINFFGKNACDGSRLRKIIVKEGGTVAMTDVNPLPKQVDLTACKRVIIGLDDLKYTKEWKYQPEALTCTEHDLDLSGENLDFSAFGRVVLERCSVGQDAKIIFRKGAEVNLCGIKDELPQDIDFSECSQVALDMEDLSYLKNLRFKKGAKVTLKNVKKLPPDMDFSECDEVNLIGCDLSSQPHLRFHDGAKVNLEKSYNLPENIDFSECAEVDLNRCDLQAQSQLRFKKGAKVNLAGATNLPNDLDFSECPEVILSRCDLRGQTRLRFMKGAKVGLNDIDKFPENFDVSPCADINFNGSDLANMSRLCFGEGAKVSMLGTTNLPKNVDFSAAAKLEMQGCDLAEQNQLRFRDGAKVSLTDVKNLKNGADFSNCAELKIVNGDMGELSWLGFREGSLVRLKSVSNLPAGVDFSPCANVSIEFCDLKNFSALCLGKGARVNLENVAHMPAFVDLSDCSKIDTYQCDWWNTRKLVLRNQAQINQYFDFEDKKGNQLIFTEKLSTAELQALNKERELELGMIKLRSDELKRKALNASLAQMAQGSQSKSSGSFFSRLFGRGGR